MKIAVFGHYDSRGGTAAVQLPDRPTEEDVTAAINKYDKQMFGIDEPTDPIATTAYGMDARECDKLAHEMIYDGESPGASDFLYVADIHGELPDGDLDDIGNVLIDASTEPEDGPGRGEWDKRVAAATEGKSGQEWLDAHNEFSQRDPMPEYGLADRIAITLEWPVQLEFVQPIEGFDADIKEREAEMNRAWPNGCSFSTAWTPEQAAEGKRIQSALDELEAERNARIRALAKHLKGEQVEVRRWDDDAYGFILVGEWR